MDSVNNQTEPVNPPTPPQLVQTGLKTTCNKPSNNVGKYSYDCDFLYQDLGDLVNDGFESWYKSTFYKLGKDKVLRLASIARADGINKNRYFSFLLKGELTVDKSLDTA